MKGVGMQSFIEFFEAHSSEVYSALLTIFLSAASFLVIFFRTKAKRIQNIVSECSRAHLDDVNFDDYEISIDGSKYYPLSACIVRKKNGGKKNDSTQN